MLFSHDTELTLRAAATLINTDRDDGEQLGDQAALDAYLDSFGWTGRRDHALLGLAAQTGLRASELIGLRCADIHLGAGAHVNCLGKGTEVADHATHDRDNRHPTRLVGRACRPSGRSTLPVPNRKGAQP